MASGPLGNPSPWFSSLLMCADTGAFVMGLGLLWRTDWGGRWRDVSVPLVVSGGLLLFGGVLGRHLTQSSFAYMRVACSALFCVLAPLLALRGAYLLRSRRALGACMLVLGIGMDAVYVRACEVEPFDLQVRRYEVVSPAYRGRPLRIALISDLQTNHVTAYEQAAFDLVEAERPDLILLTGDYLQVLSQEEYDRERPALLALFDRIRHQPSLGAFAVHGDVDWSLHSLDGAPVRMLDDEAVVLPQAGIQIIGLANVFGRRALPPALDAAARAYKGLTIVAVHRPDVAADALFNGVDGAAGRLLFVAGHTHGGQIVLPGFGPLMTLSSLPRRYAGGFHALPRRGDDGTGGWLTVSRGVGCEREWAPRIRLFCPPELVFITVRGE